MELLEPELLHRATVICETLSAYNAHTLPHSRRVPAAAAAVNVQLAAENLPPLSPNEIRHLRIVTVPDLADPAVTAANRRTVIAAAVAEYRREPGLPSVCSLGAWIDMALRDRGYAALAPDEHQPGDG